MHSLTFLSHNTYQTHSCTQKASLIANVRFRALPADGDFRLRGETVRAEIRKDIEAGLIPFFLTATIGTTSSGAIDPIDEIGKALEGMNVWLVRVLFFFFLVPCFGFYHSL